MNSERWSVDKYTDTLIILEPKKCLFNFYAEKDFKMILSVEINL